MDPLEGVRVLDFTRVLAGPYCTMLMADMGADVTKVESLNGDSTRAWVAGATSPVAFHNVNRGKRSLAVDLRSSRGQEILFELARGSDVLVENFRPGTMEKLGISYERLKKVHPAVVYCSISGFGQSGPDRSRGGYDLIAQAASGIMSITGQEGSTEPVKCGVPIADLSAGLFALIGILAALRRAEERGVGEHLDISLIESAAALTVWETAEYWLTGEAPGPTGSAHRLSAPYQAFLTADRPLAVAANSDAHFQTLLDILDLALLAEDDRFRSVGSRTEHRAELALLLEKRFKQHPASHWRARLDAAGIPASEIRTIPGMLDDPHLRDREVSSVIQDEDGSSIPILSTPITRQFKSASGKVPGPHLGEHSRDVLEDLLGMPTHDIETLFSAGVVVSNKGWE